MVPTRAPDDLVVVSLSDEAQTALKRQALSQAARRSVDGGVAITFSRDGQVGSLQIGDVVVPMNVSKTSTPFTCVREDRAGSAAGRAVPDAFENIGDVALRCVVERTATPEILRRTAEKIGAEDRRKRSCSTRPLDPAELSTSGVTKRVRGEIRPASTVPRKAVAATKSPAVVRESSRAVIDTRRRSPLGLHSRTAQANAAPLRTAVLALPSATAPPATTAPPKAVDTPSKASPPKAVDTSKPPLSKAVDTCSSAAVAPPPVTAPTESVEATLSAEDRHALSLPVYNALCTALDTIKREFESTVQQMVTAKDAGDTPRADALDALLQDKYKLLEECYRVVHRTCSTRQAELLELEKAMGRPGRGEV